MIIDASVLAKLRPRLGATFRLIRIKLLLFFSIASVCAAPTKAVSDPLAHSITDPIAVYDGFARDLEERRAELDRMGGSAALRQAVADFFTKLEEGGDARLPEPYRTYFGLDDWSELNGNLVGHHTSLFSVQIVDLRSNLSVDEAVARIVVTGVTEGSLFARYARLTLTRTSGVWFVRHVADDPDAPLQ